MKSERTTLRTIFICGLSIVLGNSGGSSTAIQRESNWSNVDKPMEKRAYTYVAEYKRLPVYNFGLGKRGAGYSDADEDKRSPQYSFGLGKRYSKVYGFGLGKRNNDDDIEYLHPLTMRLDLNDDEDQHQQQQQQKQQQQQQQQRDQEEQQNEKRTARVYSFGLGKRIWDYNKRQNEEVVRKYQFGLGKRGIVQEES